MSSVRDGSLDESTVSPDPIVQFLAWQREARQTSMIEPDAMSLATAGADCRPSARMVLLRGVDERGFVFFTNYESEKGADLTAVPFAAAVFYWDALRRQVRVAGTVARIAPEESDAYFARRPRGHRLGAWASAQSSAIPHRSVLEARMAEVARRFCEREVTRPPYWGGYRIAPQSIEFWQHRDDRMHDRIRYVRDQSGWRIERLSP